MKAKTSRAYQTTLLTIILTFTLTSATWFAYVAACFISPYSTACKFPYGHHVVIIGTMATVLLWIASHQAERLKRRLRRGMYGRVSGVAPAGLFSSAVRLAVEGEWGQVELTDRARWWVDTPIEGGTRVLVNRQDMYEWLVDVNALRFSLKPGRSPIARREWERLIGKLQWDARCRLLLAVGAAVQNTSDARSRRLVRHDISRILEDLEQLATFGDG